MLPNAHNSAFNRMYSEGERGGGGTAKHTGLCALLRSPHSGGAAALYTRCGARSGEAPRVAHSSEKASQRSTSGWLEGIAGGAKEREGVYVTSNTPLSTAYE